MTSKDAYKTANLTRASVSSSQFLSTKDRNPNFAILMWADYLIYESEKF